MCATPTTHDDSTTMGIRQRGQGFGNLSDTLPIMGKSKPWSRWLTGKFGERWHVHTNLRHGANTRAIITEVNNYRSRELMHQLRISGHILHLLHDMGRWSAISGK
jgi:hypothetical protein